MSEQLDAFPETLPVEVEITDKGHLMELGEFLGLRTAVEELEKAPQRGLPGFALALAMLQAREANKRGALVERNIRAIAKAGHDIAIYRSVASKGATLLCQPYPPEELG